MNYKSFNLGDWIGHISGVIEDETTLDGNEMRDLVEFLSTLEPCEDAISRQAALDIAFKYCPDDDGTCLEARSDLRNMLDEIEALPPAQPEQRWIPCSERLPEEPYGCLATVWDTNPVTMDEFENILPYFVGWDGEQWNDDDGEQCPFEVVAWMPLPEPYKQKVRIRNDKSTKKSGI